MFYCRQDFRKRKRIFSDVTPPRYISDDILGGHEQRVDILESLELCLIDLADDAGIVRRQLHRLVRELGREVRQVRVRFQPGKSRWLSLTSVLSSVEYP
jgi:hypothetical protein